MNRYAIGDIHGGAKTLHFLLQQLRLGRNDRLFLLGDYIDRGPDSKGVLDIILNLIEEGYDVRPVKGNHEDMLLRNVSGQHNDYSLKWPTGWGAKALKSLGVAAAIDIPTRYLTLLESFPCLQCDEDFIFVHAGLRMDVDDPLTGTSESEMMWGELDTAYAWKLGGRKLVTGHMVKTIRQIKESLLTDHIYLDNGAFTGGRLPDMGNLVALNLDTQEITLQEWLDE